MAQVFIPARVFDWGTIEVETQSGWVPVRGNSTALGYIPAYRNLDDLVADHGVECPYMVVRYNG